MKDYKNEYPLNTFSGETKKELEKLLDKVIRETTKCVCNKMIGEEENKRIAGVGKGDYRYHSIKVYNRRIKEEKEIKKSIIENL